jgi:Ca-activated chloride channel family protein
MTIDSSDPRLTAYVLDELDEAERGEIDAALADDTAANSTSSNGAELRDTVAQLRNASELLTAALGGGRSILEAEHRVPLLACPAVSEGSAVEHEPKTGDPIGRRRRRYVVLALAAIVLVAITVPVKDAVRTQRLAQQPGGQGGVTEDFNSLIDLITSTIQPTTSEGVEGSDKVESYRNNLSVVISNSEDVDDQQGSGHQAPMVADVPINYPDQEYWYGLNERRPAVSAEVGALGGNGIDGHGIPGRGRAARNVGGDVNTPDDLRVTRPSDSRRSLESIHAIGGSPGNLYASGDGTANLNRHGAVAEKPAVPSEQDADRLDLSIRRGTADGGQIVAELGDLQEGELADAREALNEALTLRPELKPEALKKLQELQQQVAEDPTHNTEAYARIYDNRFLRPLDSPLSTFSIDVDTAAYANLRRFLRQGSLPPADSVRIEELVNYFSYQYAPPTDEKPFAVHTEVTACPWNPEHRLVRIALKGREIKVDARPPSNLVFLLDVSGSMDQPNKLPLVKRAMHLLVEKLGENDRVAIVVYAGASGLVLPSTTANNRETILAAIDNLQPGGSTNGASGIELAYQIAAANQIKEGVNRVILATDGDFNVGVTNDGDLTRLIEDKAKSGVFLTVLGFGMGNLKDATLERLADKGNGNYGYIDTENEARKLLVEQLSGTLVTIAKDVKLQIEFNPARVAAYRLLGYENRLLAAEDFNDDTKDAGEIGAGHAVTAFYEIVPVAPPTAQQNSAQQPATDKPAEDQPAEVAAAEPPTETTPVDPLKYQRPAELTDAARATPELLTLKLRYKEPDGVTSRLLEFGVADGDRPIGEAAEDTRFAASVALFGMLLRQSPHAGSGTLAGVLEMADSSRKADEHGYRAEFVELVKQAMTLVKPQQ